MGRARDPRAACPASRDLLIDTPTAGRSGSATSPTSGSGQPDRHRAARRSRASSTSTRLSGGATRRAVAGRGGARCSGREFPLEYHAEFGGLRRRSRMRDLGSGVGSPPRWPSSCSCRPRSAAGGSPLTFVALPVALAGGRRAADRRWLVSSGPLGGYAAVSRDRSSGRGAHQTRSCTGAGAGSGPPATGRIAAPEQLGDRSWPRRSRRSPLLLPLVVLGGLAGFGARSPDGHRRARRPGHRAVLPTCSSSPALYLRLGRAAGGTRG